MVCSGQDILIIKINNVLLPSVYLLSNEQLAKRSNTSGNTVNKQVKE